MHTLWIKFYSFFLFFTYRKKVRFCKNSFSANFFLTFGANHRSLFFFSILYLFFFFTFLFAFFFFCFLHLCLFLFHFSPHCLFIHFSHLCFFFHFPLSLLFFAPPVCLFYLPFFDLLAINEPFIFQQRLKRKMIFLK